jgi:hypothetical protein
MRDKIDQLESAGQGLIGKTYKKEEQQIENIPEDQGELKKKFDK